MFTHSSVSQALSRRRRLLRGAMSTLSLAGAALAASPAASEVRFSREADGADYAVKVMTWWDIPFRSVVRQQYDFSCGSAAVATLLSYHYGRKTTEQEPFKWMWDNGNQEVIRKVGFSMAEMRRYLGSIDLRAEGYRLTLDQLRRLDRPSIALIDYKGFKHFVVVKGARGNRILVGDSVLGLTEYDINDFGKMWNGIVLAVVPSEGPKPKYDLASDWGPWSRAPLDQGSSRGIRIAIGDLTTHLPQDYQIVPHILLDVQVGTVK